MKANPFRRIVRNSMVTIRKGISLRMISCPPPSPTLTQQHTIAPASAALRHERVVFPSGFGIERSPFQGPPTDANNQLWDDLYNCKFARRREFRLSLYFADLSPVGITRLSADEARPMENKTLPIPGPEGGYVVQLAVFHHLHCLVEICRSSIDDRVLPLTKTLE